MAKKPVDPYAFDVPERSSFNEKDGTSPLVLQPVYGNRLEVLAPHDPVSMTRQEFADECDINSIMKRYEGSWPPPSMRPPMYVDFTAVPSDLQGALNMQMAASEAFMQLPASVRKEFDNDAVRFVEYAADRDNLPQLREWGLAAPEKVPDPPTRVEVVNPAPAPEKPA